MPEERDLLTEWERRRVDEELRDLRKVVSEMVPRPEHEAIWAADREVRTRIQHDMDQLKKDVKDLRDEVRKGFAEFEKSQIPPWIFGAVAFLTPILLAIVNHFWK